MWLFQDMCKFVCVCVCVCSKKGGNGRWGEYVSSRSLYVCCVRCVPGCDQRPRLTQRKTREGKAKKKCARSEPLTSTDLLV